MPEPLPLFDKYFNKEDADFYEGLLVNNGLHPLLEKPKGSFDAITGYAQVSIQFILRLPQHQFAAALQLIEQEIVRQGIPESHYLRASGSDELRQVLLNADEWSREDVAVARLLLLEKNIAISEEAILLAKENKKKLNQQQQKIPAPVLVLLYCLAPFGALLSMAAGIIIYSIMDTDRDGNRYYVYSPAMRNHGLAIFLAGIISSFIWILFYESIRQSFL